MARTAKSVKDRGFVDGECLLVVLGFRSSIKNQWQPEASKAGHASAAGSDLATLLGQDSP